MKEGKMVIPHLFRCPISLDLYTDPVTLSTGQTYDRSSIEKWLSYGNQTCPVTMQKLQDPSMIPNHTLRHLINQWVQMGHQFDPHFLKINDPDFPFAASLKHNLESLEPTFETLRQIQDLPQSCLVQLGFFPLLLKLVFRENEGEFSQENLIFLENSLVCVLKLLPFSDLGELNILKEEPTLAYFVVLFDKGTITIKRSLCNLVEAISSSFETKELCLILANTPLLMRKLIHFLEDDNKDAVKAIFALSSLELNRENLIKEGAVQGLLAHILSAKTSERKTSVKVAMGTLEMLLGVESGREAIAHIPSGIHALVKMVFRYSDQEGSESAVNSLMMVCCESLHVREEAICAGVLSQLLLLLQSQCSERTKTGARMLLKLLRSTWAEDQKSV